MSQNSVSRAMSVPEIRHMILTRVKKLRDLARCARVSKLWHAYIIPYLWKGEILAKDRNGENKMLAALATLSDDAGRFKHYASHLQRLECTFKQSSMSEFRAAPLSSVYYLQILQPYLWDSTQLRYLSLWVAGCPRMRQYSLWSGQLELPIPLLHHNLRKLQLAGFPLTDDFLEACTGLSLRGLFLVLDYDDGDTRRLGQLIRGQKDLLALDLVFGNEPEEGYQALLAQIAELRQLKHFRLGQDQLESQPSTIPINHKLESLQSLHLDKNSILSSFLHLPTPLQLRRIVVYDTNTTRCGVSANPMKLHKILGQLARMPTLEEVTLFYRTDDGSSKLDTALQSFTTACPHLRQLRIVRSFFSSNRSASEETLLHIVRSCPKLTELKFGLSVSSGSVISVVEDILKALPDLITLDVDIYCNLSGLARLPKLDPVPPLEKLRLGTIQFYSENGGYSTPLAEDAPAKILDVLMTHLPHLREIQAEQVADDESRDALYIWNKSLYQNRPAAREVVSEFFDQLDKDILTGQDS